MHTTASFMPSRRLGLLCILALMIPLAAVEGQFVLTTNNGAITIVQWSEPTEVVDVPDTVYGMPVTSLGEEAFAYEDSITYVTIPNSVTNIGAFAFFGCTALSGLSMPSSLISIEAQAFQDCASLTNVSLGGSLLTIGDFAFSGCTSLTSIVMPDSVSSVGAGAFRDCLSLTNAACGKGVTNLTSNTFLACTNLVAIDVDPFNPLFSCLGGVLYDKTLATLITCPEGKLGNYTISHSTTAIKEFAFFRCANLAAWRFPRA